MFCGISFFALAVLCLLISVSAFAQEGDLDNKPPDGITPEEIIKRFAAKEKEFKEARDQYTYRQDITVKTLDGSTVYSFTLAPKPDLDTVITINGKAHQGRSACKGGIAIDIVDWEPTDQMCAVTPKK